MMGKQKRYWVYLFLGIFMLNIYHVLGQTSDFGIWTSAGIQKETGKMEFGVATELRTLNNSSDIDRWSLQTEASYNVFKPLKIGVGYQVMEYHDLKYNDFQLRHRLNFSVTGKQKLGDFSFSFRERLQFTTKDDRDRVKANGTIDTYAISPAWMWRNRFKVDWNIPKFPVNPSLSLETFYQLNNPDGNQFSKLRYNLSANYKVTKHQNLEVFCLFDKEINTNNPENRWVAGIGYLFNLK